MVGVQGLAPLPQMWFKYMIFAVKERSPLKNISHRAIALATAMNW
ncbi:MULTISPECIES: hypothetical protein [unclassified Nostoc]|nr:hypothetical protein [Nostoc sp. JL23]